MRTMPTDDFDAEELSALNAEPWQIELLALNPEYVFWGPHEDYMCQRGQWNSPLTFASWSAFGPWTLDELNECVNFYFEVDRRPLAPAAHVNLVLWWAHPRKGATRGIEVTIQRWDLPAVFAFLAEAATRNAERFAKVVAKAGATEGA